MDAIPKRSSRAELALAIFEYALDDREYNGRDPWAKAIMPTVKKSIDRSVQNALNGRKGGQKSVESRSTATSDANTTASSDASSDATSDPSSTAQNTYNNNINNNELPFTSYEVQKEDKEKAEPSSSPKFVFKKALIDRGCSNQIASDYMAIRNKRRAPSTITAFERIEKEAEKYIAARPGATFEDVVRLMIEHNWLGFEAAWVKDTGTADSEESEYVKAMNAQIRRQREIDAELEAERQRRKREAANNNK